MRSSDGDEFAKVCCWCGIALYWSRGEGQKRLTVDHVNGRRDDNEISNLVPACDKCQHRHGSVSWEGYPQLPIQLGLAFPPWPVVGGAQPGTSSQPAAIARGGPCCRTVAALQELTGTLVEVRRRFE